MSTGMPHQQFANCIKACYDCAKACNHCAASCLKEQDIKAMTRFIALDLDCAQTCELAAALMVRASESSKRICTTCAEICKLCGQECARHSMAHCQVCAQAFRRSGAARKSARKWQQLHDLVEPFTGLHQKADVAGEPLKPDT
jgi:hypothetical protein